MKVLLILIDGMRPDAMTGCGSGFVRTMRGQSIYTLSAKTVVPPVTLPCHVSLFHSVDPSRHGVLTNVYTPQVRPIDGICEALKKSGKTSAMFYNWEQLRDIARPGSLMKSSFVSGKLEGYDKAVESIRKDVCACLKEQRPDFCFFYIGAPDAAGHDHGWMSREYLDSVKKSLACAKKVMKAAGEEYITILTADHGGHDRNHGLDIPEDMTIPLFLIHPSFRGKILNNASILDIAPTVLGILGAKAPDEWEGKDILK